MPGTVDDFIKRFSGSDTMDDREAAQYADRFASSAAEDQDFDRDTMVSAGSEYLGKLPEPQFQEAARNAFSSAGPQQQQGLIGSLMRALQNRGADVGSVLGGRSNPSQIGADDYARLASYARQRHPDAMRDVVQEQPWFMKAAGNPILMGALGMIASRMIKNRMGSSPPQRQGGGLLGKLF